jgi:hypothetical protein
MRFRRRQFLLLLGALVAANFATAAKAALPIELEVAVTQSAPLGAMQDWGKLLADMDLARLRLRGARHGEKPSITPSGDGAQKRYRVVAMLNHRDQLIFPGRAFGRGDIQRLREFLAALPERTEEQGVERGIFDLTRPQFEELYKDLAGVVEIKTKGAPLESSVAVLTREVKTPVQIDADSRSILAGANPIAVELKGLSTGTALAIALRPAGLAVVPMQRRGQPLVLHVVRLDPKKESWPPGWKTTETPRQLAPAMYRVTTIEINAYSLEQALQALEPHMGVPLVFDERILAARRIEPAKIQVKFPNRRTYVRRAVDTVLSQARLGGELRIDEAGKPFYWLTAWGPDNPREQFSPPSSQDQQGRAEGSEESSARTDAPLR